MSLLRDMGGCHMTRELCLEKYSHLSREKCLLMGGSHGGFLVTHLAGQYPQDYKVGTDTVGWVVWCGVTTQMRCRQVDDVPESIPVN